MAPGSKADLKPGAQFIIMAAQKQPDGTLMAPGINVGREAARRRCTPDAPSSNAPQRRGS